ncbi:MAG TPA: protein phosphatase 2C domain-containing protein [Sedimentisphaerales bacterium]|nr:protein phosphatase 2C domain-containing protein [Sedimentisphaerales bacterium]
MPNQSAHTLILHLPFSWGAATDTGSVRSENQDAFLVEPELGLFLVSDGMGGHRGGALAANMVAEDLPVMIETRLGELKSVTPRTIRALLKKTIAEQNRQLRLEGASETGYRGMGATLVILLLKDGRAYTANLGDSRIYRFRAGRLTQLTKDHSVVSELLSEGKIKPEEAQDHAAAAEITGYVGMEEEVEPYVRSFILGNNDRFLLCTDGLTAMVSDADIAEILRNRQDAASASEALITAANAAGGYDNITAVTVDWHGRS